MKVVKRQHSYKKYQHWIMTTLWLGFGLVYVLNEDILNVMSFGYLVVGIGEISLQLYYQKKGRAEKSISWSKEEVIVQELFQKPKKYRVGEIDQITVTTYNFLLKSSNAKGVMLDLQGFSEEDVIKLRNTFTETFRPSEKEAYSLN